MLLVGWFTTAIAQRLPGYMKDMKELLKALDDNLSWVTCNMVVLYTSIPHNRAFMALSFHLVRYRNYTLELREYILEVTTFLLLHNFFAFNYQYYMQKHGCPMGACFSPSLANLYMGWWEEGRLYVIGNPYRESIAWYGHYIDNLLLIWKANVDVLPHFLT